jgi:hypothetical protein
MLHTYEIILQKYEPFQELLAFMSMELLCIYGLSFQQYSVYIKRIQQTKALENIAPLKATSFVENVKLLE